jgi:hypothetical protein
MPCPGEGQSMLAAIVSAAAMLVMVVGCVGML